VYHLNKWCQARTLRKEAKWYFMDWTYSSGEGSRFENMIASSLYRFVTSLEDRGWPEVKLYFMKTYDKKEVDFVLTLDEKPILAIETKLGGAKFPSQLRKLRHNIGRNFPLLKVTSEPGVFVRKGHGEYIVGYDRLLMAT